MEGPMVELPTWNGGELSQVPDIDFLFFDSIFPPPEAPLPPISPTFSLIDQQNDEVPNIEEVPELVSDTESVPQSVPQPGLPAVPPPLPQEIIALQSLVNDLLQCVVTLEDQLQHEQERAKALEGYVTQLEPYLLHLGSTVEDMIAEN